MDFSTRDGAALISGGSGGVGAATARRLADLGSRVIVTYYRNPSAAEALVAEIEALGRPARALPVDLRDSAAVEAMVGEAAGLFDGIHTVVAAHGPFIHMKHVSRVSAEMFRDTMESDVFATFNLLTAALPHLRQSQGSIVAVSTPALRRTTKKDLLSAAPKAVAEALVRQIAAEEGRFGVRANSVAIGMITSGMHDALIDAGDFDQAYLDKAILNAPLRRFGTAEDVADAIAFFASGRARQLTGQVLSVDAGYSI